MKYLIYLYGIFVLSVLLVAFVFISSEVDVNNLSKSDTKELVVDKVSEDDVDKIGPYENPFFIYGSDFGNMLQTLYKHGLFEDMMSFTHSSSIELHGRDNIIDFYSNELNFGYDLGVRPISCFYFGDTIVLNYECNMIATKRIKRIKCIIENDSCKIVLPKVLKKFPS